eukprot:m51a1_g8871 putative pas domain-containing protein tyrosine kinase (1172) ;mRNA; r:600159-604604
MAEQGAAEGLDAAIREAALLTKVPLRLARLSHVSEAELMRNVEHLVENESVFLVATTTGTSDTEPRMLRYLGAAGVPLVGSLSASMSLRDVAGLTALYERTGTPLPPGYPGFTELLPYVVNVRASGGDEVDAVLSLVSHDWDVLRQFGVVTHPMQYDAWAVDYINASLRVLTGTNGLLSSIVLERELASYRRSYVYTAREMDAKVEELFQEPAPRAIIVGTRPNTTAAFMTSLALSKRRNLKVFFVSRVSAEDLSTRMSAITKALLANNNVQMFFTQNVPFPAISATSPWLAMPLLRRFLASDCKTKSHSALEGYLTGWFIYDVAQKAIARQGAPLTRQRFLHTVFVDVHTFDVQGMTLGPYGAVGTSQDECNQGVHEVFNTIYDSSTDTQIPVPGVTLKFADCMAPDWSSGGEVTVVGSFDDKANGVELEVRPGLLGALNDHNSEGASSMLLRSMLTANITKSAKDLADGNVVAVVTPELLKWTDIDLFDRFATIAPMPVQSDFIRPFKRRVINLFPSAFDEMKAAYMFFMNRSVTKVAIIRNDNSTYTDQCIAGLRQINTSNALQVHVINQTAEEFIQKHDTEFDAFLILGGTFDADSTPDSTTTRLLNSQVVSTHIYYANSTVSRSTFTLSIYPPMTFFASTSSLRKDYATWVSSEVTTSKSFMGFLVGKFLSQAIDMAKGGNVHKNPTADNILDAIYERGTFTVEGYQFGPFRDQCSSNPEDCCNQGSNTVFILRGLQSQTIETSFNVGSCGWWFTYIPEKNSQDDTGLILGLAIGLGGGAKRTVEFFNIRKGDIELGQCLGQGRFGSMYMADWHGTAVAVRVISKKATPKEDQRLVKEDVLLLHKHHHPNLLMLMGYCETSTDILVVTEYMEGGTLADYLRKEKRNASVYSLVAMAFDVLKGIAYLHSCKPPIVHGSICTHNLLIDGKGTVKVSDFWFSNKRGAFSSTGSNSKSLKRAAWQPPEVIAGTFLTPATDVYAFGIVLWELIAPPEMTQSSCTSMSALESQNSAQTSSAATATPMPSPMMGVNNDNGIDVQMVQLGPPEIPPNVSPAAADLMDRCWNTQPERRPSIFQILRSWSTTFSSLGEFDIPQELIQSVGSSNAAGMYSQHSSNSEGKSPAKQAVDSGDDMAASMVSIMPFKMDCVALQVPQKPEPGLAQFAASEK